MAKSISWYWTRTEAIYYGKTSTTRSRTRPLSEMDTREPAGSTVPCDPDKLFSITLVRKRHPIRKKDGKDYKVLHWSGRPFMYEELARFQNLRQNRFWSGKPTECAEMIGDAVPAVPFSAFLKAVAKTLHETDDGNGSVSRSRYDKPFALVPSKKLPLSETSNAQKGTSVSTESRPSSDVSRKRSAPTTHRDALPTKKRATGLSSWIGSQSRY